MNALGALEPFARGWRAPPVEGEHCRMCAQPIEEQAHAHLVDLDQRALLCACDTCARLFTQAGAGGARYRAVPDRVLVDPAFRLDDARWASLQIPVRLAFLFFNSRLARWVALYPSPAGATESEPPAHALEELAAATPLVAEVEPDVEALLVHGRRGAELEAFVVSIEACYRLVGEVRLHWQGFHGGDAAWQRIDAFFTGLRARARPVRPGGTP